MKISVPCAIYTRKSSEDGLEQGFNSLDAQREACEAFILSQKAEGWKPLQPAYEDGGFSGGNTERPGLKKLLADVTAGKIRVVVVYKVDRLTRSLADFAKLVELFDAHNVSFVSVTQQFNTTSSMGRLTLNVLLSFAQFEREVTGERIRDKIAASKRKGMWMGGFVPMGYLAHERTLIIDPPNAERIRDIYRMYLTIGTVRRLKSYLDQHGWKTAVRETVPDQFKGGRPFSCGHLYRLLSNPIYIGQIAHKGEVFDGQHPAIIDKELWQAVQDKLKANKVSNKTRANSINPSLLTGLIYDEQGKRLTPTHTKKGAKRYRYYVSELLPKEGRSSNPYGLHIPAQELEDVTISSITDFLRNESNLIEIMDSHEANDVKSRLQSAANIADDLSTKDTTNKITLLQRIVHRIKVYATKLTIEVETATLWNELETKETEAQITKIEVPVQLKRSDSGMKLIVQGSNSQTEKKADPKLTALVAKAHHWFERLSTGISDSTQTIAKEEKVSNAYVTRVIYLAFLAPDIIERILSGNHPETLTARSLTQMTNMPNDWQEQRELLGM